MRNRDEIDVLIDGQVRCVIVDGMGAFMDRQDRCVIVRFEISKLMCLHDRVDMDDGIGALIDVQDRLVILVLEIGVLMDCVDRDSKVGGSDGGIVEHESVDKFGKEDKRDEDGDGQDK